MANFGFKQFDVYIYLLSHYCLHVQFFNVPFQG